MLFRCRSVWEGVLGRNHIDGFFPHSLACALIKQYHVVGLMSLHSSTINLSQSSCNESSGDCQLPFMYQYSLSHATRFKNPRCMRNKQTVTKKGQQIRLSGCSESNENSAIYNPFPLGDIHIHSALSVLGRQMPSD